MAYYALFYDAVNDFIARRATYRDEHLRLAREARARGELVLAGALADPADGALLIFQGESPAVAEAFARQDPYVKNGLITNWRVRRWTVVGAHDACAFRFLPATLHGICTPRVGPRRGLSWCDGQYAAGSRLHRNSGHHVLGIICRDRRIRRSGS